MKLVFYLFLLALSVLIQASFLAEFDLRGFPPQIGLVVLICLLACVKDLEERILILLAAIVLFSVFSNFPLIITVLILILLELILNLIFKKFLTDLSLPVILALIFIGTLFYNLALLSIISFSWRFHWIDLNVELNKILMIELFWKMFFNLLFGLILAPFILKIKNWFEKQTELKVLKS